MGPACGARSGGGEALLKPTNVIEFVKKTTNLDDMIAKRVEFLTGYQNAAYAQRYKNYVEKVRAAEAPLNSKKLTEAVARYLFKLNYRASPAATPLAHAHWKL